MTELSQLLFAIGAVLTPITIALTTWLTLRGQQGIRNEVKTVNGQTIAVLAERLEGRRISADIPVDERTHSEQGYVDRLDEQDGERDLLQTSRTGSETYFDMVRRMSNDPVLLKAVDAAEAAMRHNPPLTSQDH